MSKKQKLELTWIGKDARSKLDHAFCWAIRKRVITPSIA